MKWVYYGMMYRILFLSIAILFLCSCTRKDLGQAPLPDNYEEQFADWQEGRMESLTNPTGWMRLAGMYWLEEGENSFGSGDRVDIQFPESTLPEYAGEFILTKGKVRLQAADGVEFQYEDGTFRQKEIYDGEEALNIEYWSLEWLIIEREDLMGIRLYNKDNPKVDAFTGFDRYPLDPEWHLNAKFEPATEGETISIVNVLGQLVDTPTPGSIEFSVDGDVYTLDALEGEDQMFLIVGDLTNQTETYQAGRYIYIDYPEEGSDYTIIDFNKMYNPPCAYNLFTTCQLPPIQNRLDVAIPAGEKRAEGWEGLE
ncbi:hypothetical protein CWD77_10650 [Rhodohalobacter barkolensis]|uniref:DUF1684 domain-containing protein n=2 Tax=Rhodohalobacter barkolensis TaxID=2053187 RepID=A0A2N0VFX1_9BACT|nr:hypothetical protein CWD77_10650 [Rhodohalobacter barkolensis]